MKQGEARYFALSRAREGSFLILILGNISYLYVSRETFKKSSIYAAFAGYSSNCSCIILLLTVKKRDDIMKLFGASFIISLSERSDSPPWDIVP